MKTILIADDDSDILKPICAYLSHRNADLKTIPAANGKECVEILQREEIDVVVSDLRMPEGDGIDVLAYLSRANPSMPVIVMSGYVMSKAAEDLIKFGNLRFLSKPAGMDQIYQAITEAIREPVEIGSFNGFSLAGILQLIEMEEKTCLLEVEESETRQGFFAMVEGRMVRAACGELAGEDAALELLTWVHPQVRVRALNCSDGMEPELQCNVTELLLRSYKALDERRIDQLAEPAPAPKANLTVAGRGVDADTLGLNGSEIFQPEVPPSTADAGDEKKARRFKPFGRRSAKPKPVAAEPEPAAPPVAAPPPPPPPPPVPPAAMVPLDNGLSTSVAHQREVKIEHPSVWPGVAVFLGVAGLLIGFQWQAERFSDFMNFYVWGRSLIGFVAFALILGDAYRSSIGELALCIFFPPFAVVYALSRVTSYPQRALFLAVLVSLAAEVFFLPDQSLVLATVHLMGNFIDSVDRLIVRAGE